MIDIIGNTVNSDPSGHSASGIRLDDGGATNSRAEKLRERAGEQYPHHKTAGCRLLFHLRLWHRGSFVMLNGNYCEITERGNGFQLYGSPKGTTYNITGNTVRFINQAPNASMGGIGAIPNGPGIPSPSPRPTIAWLA